MENYLELGVKILQDGQWINTRNGKRLCCYYGESLRFNMQNGFPIITTKKVDFSKVISELCWFLKGRTDLEYLHAYNNHIWDANAENNNGTVGRIYGYQWRYYNDQIDQIALLIKNIKKRPYSTQNLVNAWNPSDIQNMALPPCHFAFQVHCSQPDKISLQVYQRSADYCLGVPYNISSYGALLCLLAQMTNRIPDHLIFTFGNVHIYEQHLEKFEKVQLERETLCLPDLQINPHITETKHLWNIEPRDFSLYHYEYHPFIKYEMIA